VNYSKSSDSAWMSTSINITQGTATISAIALYTEKKEQAN
jgi:hypothetical protein